MNTLAGQLHIRPRYHRRHVDPGTAWEESNTGPARLEWDFPLASAALVLIDVWDRFFLQDTLRRQELIIRDRIVPLLEASREAGLQIIHAPEPRLAIGHPMRVSLPEAGSTGSRQADGSGPDPEDDWPPPDFRDARGRYRTFRAPDEPREGEILQLRAERTIHPMVEPRGNDVVVATGEEFHQFCRQRKVCVLFFLGFYTNICVLFRDYGMVAMKDRGYRTVLVRDCTTAIESAQSQADLGHTAAIVHLLELTDHCSISSEELAEGMRPR